jgi:hypothetical protein
MSSIAKELGSRAMQADDTFPATTLGKVVVLLGFVVAYLLCLIVYRLYFSPLSKFPGPRIAGMQPQSSNGTSADLTTAAVTSLYALYYDMILGGRYIWKIEEMHKRYGNLARIHPTNLEG